MSDMYNFDNNNYNNENHDGFNHYEFDETTTSPNHKKFKCKDGKICKESRSHCIKCRCSSGALQQDLIRE